jgi:hypothetical protein
VFVNSYYYQCQTATATSSGVSHHFFMITVITFSSIIDAIYEDPCDKREHYNIYEHNENINWAIYIYHNHCGFDYKVSSLLKNLLLFQAQCLKILFDSIMISFLSSLVLMYTSALLNSNTDKNLNQPCPVSLSSPISLGLLWFLGPS